MRLQSCRNLRLGAPWKPHQRMWTSLNTQFGTCLPDMLQMWRCQWSVSFWRCQGWCWPLNHTSFFRGFTWNFVLVRNRCLAPSRGDDELCYWVVSKKRNRWHASNFHSKQVVVKSLEQNIEIGNSDEFGFVVAFCQYENFVELWGVIFLIFVLHD